MLLLCLSCLGLPEITNSTNLRQWGYIILTPLCWEENSYPREEASKNQKVCSLCLIILRGRIHHHSSQMSRGSQTKFIRVRRISSVPGTTRPPCQLLRTRSILTIEYLRNHTGLRATVPMLTLRRRETSPGLAPIMRASHSLPKLSHGASITNSTDFLHYINIKPSVN